MFLEGIIVGTCAIVCLCAGIVAVNSIKAVNLLCEIRTDVNKIREKNES